jgi:hypothetical protein
MSCAYPRCRQPRRLQYREKDLCRGHRETLAGLSLGSEAESDFLRKIGLGCLVTEREQHAATMAAVNQS